MVVVLGGDVGPIAWLAQTDCTGGMLIQIIACDGDAPISTLLRNPTLIDPDRLSSAEQIEFDTGASGTLVLIDASESGNSVVNERETLELRPGRYRLFAFYVDNDVCKVVIRQLMAVSV